VHLGSGLSPYLLLCHERFIGLDAIRHDVVLMGEKPGKIEKVEHHQF